MGNREYSATDAAHSLPGFSSNSHWAEEQEGGAWSHNPVHPGPKEGFRDPAVVPPVRKQLPLNVKEI